MPIFLNKFVFSDLVNSLFMLQEVSDILAKVSKLWEHTKGVENNVRQVELDSMQVRILPGEIVKDCGRN